MLPINLAPAFWTSPQELVRISLLALATYPNNHIGKFTEVLAQREEGYRIIAVEPHEQMRTNLAKKELPEVAVKDGGAYDIPVEDNSMDAIIIAQVNSSSYIQLW